MYADPFLGRTVEIQHDYGLTTVYGNFGEILVEKGQWIRQGDHRQSGRSRRQSWGQSPF